MFSGWDFKKYVGGGVERLFAVGGKYYWDWGGRRFEEF